MHTPSSRDNPPTPRRGIRVGRILARIARFLAAATALGVLLAGLPWALARMAGWPLPDHLPTWREIQGVLLAPLSATFLLNALTCVCWLLWGMFTAAMARSAVDIVRHARIPGPHTSGPIRRAAAVLVSSILISLIGHRTSLATGNPTSQPVTGVDVVMSGPSAPASAVTQPAASSPGASEAGVERNVHVASGRWTLTDTPPSARTGNSVTVRPPDPDTGVHDSLWRIAQRTLGDGDRWPEIYALNKGKPQPGGRTLNRPTLIYPGEQLQLPTDATTPATRPDPGADLEPDTAPEPAADAPGQRPRPPAAPTPRPPFPDTSSPRDPTPFETPTTPDTRVSDTPPPPRSTPPEASQAAGDPGFRFGEELFVGVGLAAAVSTALIIARRRQRRRYRPGSGDRADLSIAPAVYQLRLAHLRTEQDRAEQNRGEQGGPEWNKAGKAGVDGELVATSHKSEAPMVLGVRDGREIALDLAAAHGLGLMGAGATAAVRALMVSTLAATPHAKRHTAKVVVAAADLTVLLGESSRGGAWRACPALLRVAANLDAALDELEAEILVRAGTPRPPRGGWPPVLLITSTPQRARQRLQAILDNGANLGVIGLLLGQWPAGVTAYVRDNGAISTTNPGLGEHLRGTRVFHLGADDTSDLLSLLHDADPDQGGRLDQRNPVTPEDRAPAVDSLEIVQDTHTSGLEPDPLPATHSLPPVPVTTAGHNQIVDQQTTVDAGKRSDRDRSLPTSPLRINVLGPARVWWRDTPTVPDLINTGVTEHEITSEFQPRARELLVFLALHPDGATREALTAAMWPTSPPEKTTNAMNTGLTRLRRAVATATAHTLTDVVLTGDGRYRLNPDLVDVDYHRFAQALTDRRTAHTEHDRIDAYRRIVDNYTGPLADGLSTDWIETAREAIRRDAIDAVAALARALVEDDPQQTLDLLEIARAFDPHNELIYRDIMRLQERLGQLDAIPRTLTLLTTRLAEIDATPTPQARGLAARLRQRHEDGSAGAANAQAEDDHGRSAVS